jgi:hypothetical protein
MRRRPLSRLRRAVGGRPPLRIPKQANDVETATLRYLLFVLLPAWFLPGVADWWRHRRTDIEHTAGVRESLIHALMMAEVGVPITLALLCEINPLALTVMVGSIGMHEATALWDVRTAERAGREVTPLEQHIHSFLESLPFMGVSAVACVHWREVQRLLRGERRSDDWRLVPKKNRLPRSYLAAVAAGIGGLIVVPYAEELLRCLRAARQRAESRPPDTVAEHRQATDGRTAPMRG